jgi:GAF domain-containing protein
MGEQGATQHIALPEAIAGMAGIVLGHLPFDLVLERLTDVTKQTVTGAYAVSVTMHDRRPVTVAASSPFAEAIDEYQYEARSGPCLEALRSGQTVVVTDQNTETRWPGYSRRAAAAGVGSSVSVPLLIEHQHVAALNIYGHQTQAFTPHAIATAEQLAVYAAVVVSNADMYLSATARAEELVEAVAGRAVIEQAKGAVMADRHCTAADAFALLIELSHQSGRKLQAVAADLVGQIGPSP